MRNRPWWCWLTLLAAFAYIGVATPMIIGCTADKPEPPADTRTIISPDGKTYIVPKDAVVEFEWVERDTTTMSGSGGSFDSFRTVGGEFEPGGPKEFDLHNATWSQFTTLFKFKQNGNGLGQIFLLGAVAVIGGAIAFAITKLPRYLYISGAGIGLIVLGYFLQEYGGVLFIVALVGGLIWFIFGTAAGKKLRDKLGLTTATLGAVTKGVKKTEKTNAAASEAVKENIGDEMDKIDWPTADMNRLVDEVKS